MKTLSTIIASAALALAFTAPVVAQTAFAASVSTEQTMRSSKLVGVQVYNEQGQKIGSIVDLVVSTRGGEPAAILSVGDFVGGGAKMVAVPLSHVKMSGGKATMAGATNEFLASMPFYTFPGGNG
jgi:sporulation protein YlmC with PRC-barrel domain